MSEAFVVGCPIAHSLSPAIFSFLARERKQTKFHYFAREVSAAQLKNFVSESRRNANLAGFNVTLPHKEAILQELDEMSDDARQMGAVNVVKREGDVFKGYNSDWVGVVNTLTEIHNPSFYQAKSAVLFGAGGAARAVSFALGKLKLKHVFVLNRSRARADRLASEMNRFFPSTHFEALDLKAVPKSEISLIVNASSVGMSGSPDTDSHDLFSKITAFKFSESALAFDLVYTPEETYFLTQLSQKGLQTVGGLSMLVYQALESWELWFGPDEKLGSLKTPLTQHLRKILKKSRPIFLTGFMGVGKSFVAISLAEHLSLRSLDTDEWIKKESGLSISAIFEKFGEAHFRKLEKKALLHASAQKKCVVALGGGALMDRENLELVEKSGLLIFLEAELSTIEERLNRNQSSRPILRGLEADERSAKIKFLMQERKASYERAQIRVKTDGLSPESIVAKIESEIMRLQKEGLS